MANVALERGDIQHQALRLLLAVVSIAYFHSLRRRATATITTEAKIKHKKAITA
ncbi:MAG: hypothetical protein SNH27_14310 [Rikenellaceae bacterium]